MTPEWTAVFSLCLMTMGLGVVFLSALDRAAKRAKANGGKPTFTRANLLEIAGLLLGLLGVAGLSILVMALGWFWLLEAPMELLIGWARYLNRVLEQVEPDPWAVASGVVCAALVVFGSHRFLRWLAASTDRTWPLRRTVQLLVFVVMMFVVGLAFTGLVQQTGWLIRTPDPLVKDRRSIS
jgi:hypothetical protein